MLRSVDCNVGEVIPFLMDVPQPVKVANFCKHNNKSKNYAIKYVLLLFSVNKNMNVTTLGTTAAGRFLVWLKSPDKKSPCCKHINLALHMQEREREKGRGREKGEGKEEIDRLD
jgi:hypothetical protein